MKKGFKIQREKLKLTTFAFTLIELIGVIILLSILALIAIPRVVEEIEKTKTLAMEQKISVLKESGLLYSVKFDLGYEDNITKTIDFDTLVSSGFLKEDTILNEKGDRIEGCLKYKWVNNSNQYEFWYDKECIDVLNDEISPTVVFNVVGNPFNSNGWANNDFYVNINVIDNESGSHSYKWCSGINNCEPKPLVEASNGKALISINSDNLVVCAIGYDKAGNPSAKTCSDLYKLDKVKPVFEGINDLIVNRDGIADLQLGVIANDSLSEINGSYNYNPTSVNMSMVGITNITYRVSDKAGNETVITRKIIVDAEAPTVQYTALGNKINTNGWSKEDFFVEAVLVDRSGLGIKSAKWCSTTNNTCTPIADMIGSSMTPLISTESNNNRICIQATDNNNKTSAVICSDAYKLDKTKPTAGVINVSGTLGANSWYTTNVTLTSTNGSDALSGHDKTTLNISSITSNTSGTTVTLTTTDKAGNTSYSTKVIKVDKTKPTVTATGSSVTITQGDSNQVSNYFTTSYSISGVSISCTPTNTSTLSVGSQTVGCKATGGNGLTTTSTKTITVKSKSIILNIDSYTEITNNFTLVRYGNYDTAPSLTYDAGTAKFSTTKLDNWYSLHLKPITAGINNIEFSMGVWPGDNTTFLINDFFITLNDGKTIYFYVKHKSTATWSKYLPANPAYTNAFAVLNNIDGSSANLGAPVPDGYVQYNISVNASGVLTMNASSGHTYSFNIGTRKITKITFVPTNQWWNTSTIGRLDYLKYELN